ncbi:MAG: hypothetical protein O2820_05090 [Planctomycetota bacterium]|nr:hypothetical protein [Planctomycetota bacterium]MDA1248579.1 hypothetical protein [Planctomycetota bacterium]
MKVVQILHLAWPETIADERVSCDADEDRITDVLRWNLAAAKQTLDPAPELEFIREPQSDRATLDTPTGYIDIMVSYTWSEATYLTMECKRIASGNNDLALKYVRNGVNRFASGKYSPGHAYGVMVGYVICENQPRCIERVRNTVRKEPGSETGYDTEFGWQLDRQIHKDSELFRTRHRQMTLNNTIELIHCFLIVNACSVLA